MGGINTDIHPRRYAPGFQLISKIYNTSTHQVVDGGGVYNLIDSYEDVACLSSAVTSRKRGGQTMNRQVDLRGTVMHQVYSIYC